LITKVRFRATVCVVYRIRATVCVWLGGCTVIKRLGSGLPFVSFIG
jgi:hypothetical protein